MKKLVVVLVMQLLLKLGRVEGEELVGTNSRRDEKHPRIKTIIHRYQLFPLPFGEAGLTSMVVSV